LLYDARKNDMEKMFLLNNPNTIYADYRFLIKNIAEETRTYFEELKTFHVEKVTPVFNVEDFKKELQSEKR